jgi:hypothetical protein
MDGSGAGHDAAGPRTQACGPDDAYTTFLSCLTYTMSDSEDYHHQSSTAHVHQCNSPRFAPGVLARLDAGTGAGATAGQCGAGTPGSRCTLRYRFKSLRARSLQFCIALAPVMMPGCGAGTGIRAVRSAAGAGVKATPGGCTGAMRPQPADSQINACAAVIVSKSGTGPCRHAGCQQEHCSGAGMSCTWCGRQHLSSHWPSCRRQSRSRCQDRGGLRNGTRH